MMQEGAVKLKPLGPTFGEEVGAMFCPWVKAKQGAALSPYQSLGQSLKLHGTFP